MCGISGIEFLVIIVAAIIILGPEKLPDAMRLVGKLAREARRLRGNLGDVTDELRSQVNVGDIQRKLVQDLDIDRARERMKDAESEIDAIRARMNQKLQSPATNMLGDIGGAQTLAGATDEETDADAANTEPATANTEPATANASNDGLPQIRPAAGQVEQTPPPRRVTSRAKGAPTPPRPEVDDDVEREDPSE